MESLGGGVARGALRTLICGAALTVSALVIGLSPAIASADPTSSTPISLTADQLRQALFVAGDVVPVGQDEMNVIEQKLLDALYTADPTLVPTQAEATIKAVEAVASQDIPAVSVYAATNGTVAEGLGALVQASAQIDQSLAPATQNAFKVALGTVAQDAVSQAQASVPGENFDPNLLGEEMPSSFLPVAAVEQTVKLGSTNSNYETAWDDLWAQSSGDSLAETAQQLLANDPDLHDNPDMSTLLNAVGSSGSGTVNTTWGALAGAWEDEDTAVTNNETAAGTAVEAYINGGSQSTAESQQTQDAASLQDETATLAMANVMNFDSGTESSESTIVHEWDDASLLATCAITVLSPVALIHANQLNGQMIESMVLAAPRLVGSVVNALFGLNADDEIILKQLHAIQEQIAALSSQVANGFSGVDAALQQIDTTLENDTTALASASANINGIRSDMAQLEDQLDSITSDMFEIADTSRSEQLEEAVATDIGYSSRAPGNAEMPLDQFEQAAGTFYEWATAFPFDAISELPSSDWSFDPNNVFGQLSSPDDVGSQNPTYFNPLNANIDYLTEYSNNYSWTDALNSSLPNPDVWAAGASAFAQLLDENPQYVTAPLLTELQQVMDVGTQLQTGLQQLAAKGSSYAAIPLDYDTLDTGSELLNHALQNYLQQGINNSNSLLNQLEAEMNSFLALHPQRTGDASCPACELAAAPTQGSLGTPYINLWGGPNQTPNANMTAFVSRSDPAQTGSAPAGDPKALNACAGQTSTGVVGLTQSALFDPLLNVYANAWHLNLGSLTTCYDAYWSDQSDHEFGVTLYWSFGGSQVFEAGITANNIMNCSGSVSADPDLELREDWNTVADPNLADCPSMQSSGQTLEPLIAALVAQVSALTPPVKAQAFPYPIGQQGVPVCAPPSSVSSKVETCFYTVADPSALKTSVSNELTSLQKQVFTDIAPTGGQLTSSNDVLNAAARVNGAVSLVDDYIELAFPVAFSSDPELRDDVLGSQHLFDNDPADSQLYNYIRGLITSPPSSDPFILNSPFEVTMAGDAQTLSNDLNSALSSAGSSEPPKQTDVALTSTTEPLIGGTLSQLTVVNSIASNDVACQTEPSGTLGCPPNLGTSPGGTGPGGTGPGGGKPGNTSHPTPVLRLEKASVLKHDELSFKIECTGATCLGSAVAHTIERIKKPGGKVIALTAGAKHRVVQKTVVVSSTALSAKDGQTVTITAKLNRTGSKLLAKFRKLPVMFTVTLAVDGKSKVVKSVRLTLALPRVHHR